MPEETSSANPAPSDRHAVKIARMVQPESLKSDEYQPLSCGRVVDVWAMLCACITGDLETIKNLVARDPNLVECEYEYFKPIRFAVRENQRAVVDFLLENGAAAAYEAGDSLLAIARERGADVIFLDPVLPLGLIGRRLRAAPHVLIAHGAEVNVPGRLPGGRMLARRVLGAALAVHARKRETAVARKHSISPC